MPGKTVVVANDDKDILRLLEDRLRSYGLEVHTASDGVECLDVVEQVHPDLVVLDVWMPRMDGMEALSRISAQSPALPVLMVSASADQVVQSECLQRGAREYLIKPYEPAELRERVFRLLGAEA